MNFKKKIIVSVLAIALGLFTFSCSKTTTDSNSSSTNGGGDGDGDGNGTTQTSHNAGQDCLGCHKSGGPGEGIFSVGGTVYNKTQTAAFAGATVRLYTAVNGGGTLKATLTSDAIGNIHSTNSIDFSAGLFPAVEGSTGVIQYMPIATTTGACNSCHGVTTGKIWAE